MGSWFIKDHLKSPPYYPTTTPKPTKPNIHTVFAPFFNGFTLSFRGPNTRKGHFYMRALRFSGRKERLYNYGMNNDAQMSEAYASLVDRVERVLVNEPAMLALAVLSDLTECIVTHLNDETRAAGVDLIRALYTSATTNHCFCGKVMGPIK